MKCAFCGADNSDDTVVCAFCGRLVSPASSRQDNPLIKSGICGFVFGLLCFAFLFLSVLVFGKNQRAGVPLFFLTLGLDIICLVFSNIAVTKSYERGFGHRSFYRFALYLGTAVFLLWWSFILILF